MADRCRSVFIVEDEPVIAMMIKDMAKDVGWEIAGCTHTEADAFRLLGSCRPTIAVLDVNLGVTTSLGVASTCRDRGIPVLFITGYTAGDTSDLWPDTPVLCKPFSPEDLSRSLQRCLAAPSAVGRPGRSPGAASQQGMAAAREVAGPPLS